MDVTQAQAERRRLDEFLETVDRLEHAVDDGVSERVTQASMAISLRRIADALEGLLGAMTRKPDAPPAAPAEWHIDLDKRSVVHAPSQILFSFGIHDNEDAWRISTDYMMNDNPRWQGDRNELAVRAKMVALAAGMGCGKVPDPVAMVDRPDPIFAARVAETPAG